MLNLSLFILGATSLVAQVAMTRELMVSFYGNEFFIGWILSGWLFWVAAGSLLAALAKKSAFVFPLVIACHLAVAFLFPLEIFLVRVSKMMVTTAPGQIPDLLPAVAVSFFVMAPLCLVLGLQFALTTQYREQAGKALAAGKSYLWETLGFVFGGLAFSYVLVRLNEFQMSALVAGFNLTAALVLLLSFKEAGPRKLFFAILFGLAVLGIAGFRESGQINARTAAFRFPNELLIETTNSIYGNLAVTRTGDQYNFYQNGLLAGTGRDDVFSEYLVHFPLLSHPGPQKVLLIGTGFNGALREILKHDPAEIFYAELNPALIDLAGKYVAPALRRLLDDGRVRIIKGDLRYFLKTLPKDFDAVIINLPNPSTAFINRYFTDEFFKAVRLHLNPRGVLSTHLAFSPNIVPAPLEQLGVSIDRTLRDVFPSIVILPEDTLFFIASAAPLPRDPETLIQRLRARGIRNDFVTEPYLVYRYTNDRVQKVKNAFAVNKTAQRNFDLHPRSYLYNLIYWFGIFHHGIATLSAAAARTNYPAVLCLGLLLTGLPFLNSPRLDSNKPRLVSLMALGGFSLMSAEVLVIYGFQVFYGNLYYKIAWIVSAFMAGMAAGTFGGNGVRRTSLLKLASLHACIGFYFMAWLLLLRLAARSQWVLPEAVWYFLALWIGALVGFEFPYVNALLFTGQNEGRRIQTGTVYAADLLGSCLGALGVSIFMIPAYGVFKTLFLLAALNISAACLLWIGRKKSAS